MSANKLLLLALIFSTGCAGTGEIKRQLIEGAAIGALAGVVAGQLQPDNREVYSTYFGSVGALIGTAYAVYKDDPDAKIDSYRRRTEDLRAQLDEAFRPKVEAQMPGSMHAKIPEKYRQLVNPGEWRVSEIDQWIEDSENRLIHQDKIMELTPPSLNPNNFAIPKKGKDHD